MFVRADISFSFHRSARAFLLGLALVAQPVLTDAAGAAVMSAGVRAKIPPGNVLVPAANDGSDDTTTLGTDIKVFVTPGSAAASFDAIRSLAQQEGALANGFSPTFGSFRISGATVELLRLLDARADVRVIEEEGVVDTAIEVTPFNLDAQITHNVPALRAKHTLTGAGVAVGVWDEGAVLKQHVEFGPRVTSVDVVKPARHSTHVAGTIGAKGVRTKAQGMAPAVNIRSYDWSNDINELAADAGLIVASNHSYGYSRGWTWRDTGWAWYGDPAMGAVEDYLFGKYVGASQEMDQIAFTHPGLTIFRAAGNDRNDDPNDDSSWNGQYVLAATGELTTVLRQPDNFDQGGFDTIEGAALAKNVVTIGAIEDIVGHAPRPADVRVTSFSSWGPTDDGRIKPDVVSNGADLFSPTVRYRFNGTPFVDEYEVMPGTSMATPVATGVAALLQELSQKKHSRLLDSDEIKAVLIHTAMSPNPGPDYRIGWGSLLADQAGEVVAGTVGTMLRPTLTAGGLSWHGTASLRPIRATLVWIDPPAALNTAGLDDPTPTLVDDLDLELVAPDGTHHHPWSMDPSHPNALATRNTANHVDNVERVDVDASQAVAGPWTITVQGPASANGRKFALIVTGLTNVTP